MKFQSLLFFLYFSLLLNAQDIPSPSFCYLTVGEDSLVHLYWHMPDTESIDGYIIKRLILDGDSVVYGTFNNIALLPNPSLYSYIDTSKAYNTCAKPYQRSETYLVAAYKIIHDSIYYGIPSNMQKTIFLQANFQKCKRKIVFIWNKYLYRKVKKFIFFYNFNNLWKPIDVALDTTFIFEPMPNKQYYFIVKAILDSNQICTQDTSNSNIVKIYTNMSVFPDTLYIWQVNYTDNQTVKLDFIYSKGYKMKFFALLRNNDTLKKWSVNNMPKFYIDTNSYSENTYRLIAVDSCNFYKSSEQVKPITLYGEQKEDKILLYWNTYSSYINGTAYYRVFYKRRNSYIEVLRTQDSSALLSIKDLSPDPNAKYLYFFITAVEKGTNIYSLHGESTSKILKLPLKPIISIPNAIRPSSHIRENRYFIPKVAFAANVEVLIFNKNGETIFYAPHNNNYWDGTYKGKILSPGYYNYVIKIIDYQGNIIQKKGYIYLLP